MNIPYTKLMAKWTAMAAIVFVGYMATFSAVPKPPAPLPTETEKVHYITLKFTQASFTLSISQHIKDSANTFYLTLPTTQKFYDSVKEGDLLGDKFKTATFFLSGSIGSRKVYVEKKFTKDEPVDTKEGGKSDGRAK